MTAASWPLQQALFTRLTGDTGVSALLADRVFDDVPVGGAAFPYLVIGDETASDWSTATEEGSEHVISVLCFSRAGGRGEAKRVLGAVDTALVLSPPAPAGHVLVNLNRLDTAIALEPDGETTRGEARFRIVLEPV